MKTYVRQRSTRPIQSGQKNKHKMCISIRYISNNSNDNKKPTSNLRLHGAPFHERWEILLRPKITVF